MRYEQDYIMRMIKECVEAIASVVFGKKLERELPKDAELPSSSDFGAQLIALADEGKINEAENMLYEKMNPEEKEQFQIVLIFYDHINGFTDDFLECHHYSREEIIEGLEMAADKFGIGGPVKILLDELEV